MFAVKSMEVSSSLMKLKLDMVYRDLPEESARTRFTEITAPYPAEVEAAPAPAPKPKPVRKKIKLPPRTE
jgi:hypothetical protein